MRPITIGAELVGAVCGVRRITGISRETELYNTGKGRRLYHKLETVCVRCGDARVLSYFTLMTNRRLKREACSSCRKKSKVATCPKSCLRCEGQHWRRPVSGVCRCGERYSPEVMMIASGQFQSSIALCEGV